MNSPHHHPHHEHHHDVHQQRLLWFFSFCNQRSSSSSSSSTSSSGGTTATNRRAGSGRRKSARNKFAAQYQQQLQQQQRQSSNVFGRDLIEHTRLYSDDDSIPYIVKSCTRFIEKHGIIFGIYRLSGMRVNIHKLRQDFDKNPKISMIDSEAISNDAHAVACVLKQYFRELPTPLLTFHMYEKFIELFKHSNNDNSNNNLNNNNNNNEINNTNDGDNINIDTIDGQEEQNDDDDDDVIIHDNNDDVVVPKTLATTTTSSSTTSKTNETNPLSTTPMTTQLKSSKQLSTEAIATRTATQKKFTSCPPDSQLISLSSVVTTTTSDIKYQVKLDDLRRLLLQLPKAHYQTLKFLMSHLACIAANGKKTGMDSKNVAIVWAPNLLKPRELELSAGLETLQIIGLQAVITEQLIKHHKFLFGDDSVPASTNVPNDRDSTAMTPPPTPTMTTATTLPTTTIETDINVLRVDNHENSPEGTESHQLASQQPEVMHKEANTMEADHQQPPSLRHSAASDEERENEGNNFS